MLSIAHGTGTYLGVFTSAEGVENEAFKVNSGTNPAIVHIHVDWTMPTAGGSRQLVDFSVDRPDVGTSVTDLVAQSAKKNQVVALSWDPFSVELSDPGMIDGSITPAIALQQILGGEFDTYIRSVAQQVAAMDTPVMMTLFGECDAASLFGYGASGSDFMETQDDRTGQYGDPAAQDGPERVRDAFRRVIDIFKEEGADNVDWFMYFSTGVLTDQSEIHPADFYPGDAYIDWVGQSVYINGPADLAASLDAGYAAWGEVTQKPFFIPEMGLESADNPDALAQTLDALTGYDRVKAVTLSDFAAAESEYGVPRLGARSGDWPAIANAAGYLDHVSVSEDGAPAMPFGDWRDATGRSSNDNLFQGTGGDDTIIGSSGADRMEGGGGNDVYIVDQAGDVVLEVPGGGYDTVLATADHVLGPMLEMLILEGTADLNGTGNGSHNTLMGNAGNNRLVGNGGADTLDGGAGIDTLEGGAGDDLYLVGNEEDTLVEAAGGGTDVVIASVGFALGDHIETLQLEGTADLWGIGSAQANTLVGNAGANILLGGGGGDTIFANSGNDTVDGGAGDDYVEGGGGADWLYGGAGFDVLNGGAGSDTLILSDGSDLVFGGTGADVFVFYPMGGMPIIQDFTAGTDQLIVTGFGVADFGQLMDHAMDVDTGTLFEMGDGSSLFLAGVELAALSSSDFIF